MNYRLIALVWAALTGAVLFAAQAQVPMTGAGKGTPGGGFTPSCAESTAWIARALVADAAYDTTHQQQDDTFICGMVAQASTISGTLWSRIDVAVAYATQSSPVALLNMKSSSFNQTALNSPSFTADRGFASNGTTSYQDSNFNPSTAGGNYTRNSAHISSFDITSGGPAGTFVTLGGEDGGGSATNFIIPLQTGGVTAGYGINSTAGINATNAQTQGFYVAVRIDNLNSVLYKDAASIGSSAGDVSLAPINRNYAVNAWNDTGTIRFFLADRLGFVSFGDQYSATDVTNFDTLVRALLHARGAI